MELDRVPDEFIDNVFTTMTLARQHTFQVLTKWPARMAEYMKGLSADVESWPLPVERGIDRIRLVTLIKSVSDWPLPNVWLGVSVENQARADERIPLLLDTPAAVRFISAEPLLGPLDLDPYLWDDQWHRENWPSGTYKGKKHQYRREPGLDWVIVGGESGGPPERRLVERCSSSCHRYGCDGCPDCNSIVAGWEPKPEALRWVRSLRDQCQAAGIPFFFKQWGPRAGQGTEADGREWREMPRQEVRA